jgi:hypothetical protein
MTTKVNVLCLNLDKAEPFNEDLTLAGTYADNKAMMKAVSAKIDNEHQKAVHVTTSEKVETLYGLTEEEFIKYAKVLPARGTHENAEETNLNPATDADFEVQDASK